MNKIIKSLVLLTFLTALGACSTSKSDDSSSSKLTPPSNTSSFYSEDIISSEEPISSDEEVATSSDNSHPMKENELYTDNGLSIKFKNNGASIDKITWNGKQIAKDGFVVGRCANRIAGASFKIDGVTYNVSKNDGQNSLHGGAGSGMNSWRGPFATKDWTKVSQTADSITYSIHSADGENGYPGNMDMTVKYTLSEEGELSIEYRATTDKATLCNPTNHLFIDINGNRSYDNVDLVIDADSYTPLSNQIPTGEIKSVEGTQFDYRTRKAFDKSKNYDDNYVLNGVGYRQVAALFGKTSSISILVTTDRPGLQLYKDGQGNICLESQMMPDAINQENFEDPILRPGEEFYSKTSYTFLALN